MGGVFAGQASGKAPPEAAQNVGCILNTQKEACGSRITAAGFLHRVLKNKCFWPFPPIFLRLKISTFFLLFCIFFLIHPGAGVTIIEEYLLKK